MALAKLIKNSLFWGLILIIAATISSVNAAVIAPVSYDMSNGDGQANGGTYNYWDKNYTGSGNTTQDGACLSGGLGDLTDGIIATQNWSAVENAAGTGPYVGWVNRNPTITFNFGNLVNIDAVTIYVDGSNGAGAVEIPQSVDLSMGASSFNSGILVGSPNGSPTSFTFSGLGFSGSSLQLGLNRTLGWVMLSEVTFQGSTTVPKHSTFLGLSVLGGGALLKPILERAKKSNKSDD